MPISRDSYSPEEIQFIRGVGFKIQYYRKKAGISQADLAEHVDMSLTTIARLESSCLSAPSMVGLYRIAKTLGITPDKLVQLD
ncbi:XRE family transcriptional regulator [Deltaproteobacteria bacterium Smac51]|nr:XRE family transcriptional regulator [Deltaproteobacteria bacterium Smac51]